MHISDVLNKVPYAHLSPERNICMSNVLHSLLDNLGVIGCTNDVVHAYSARNAIIGVLSEEYPYVDSTLRDMFALPDVTDALIHGIDYGDCGDCDAKPLDTEDDDDDDDDDDDEDMDELDDDGADDENNGAGAGAGAGYDTEKRTAVRVVREMCSHVRIMAVTSIVFQAILTGVSILAVYSAATSTCPP
jgi:hypothetical protein